MQDKCSFCGLPMSVGDEFEVDATLGGMVKKDPRYPDSVIMKSEYILQQKFYHKRCRKTKTGQDTDSLTRIPLNVPVGRASQMQSPVIRSLNTELKH
jgi:hypothetical protein